ncbi:MAG: hypothetical protein RL693_2208 [Verrucomicrobiota bacterium]
MFLKLLGEGALVAESHIAGDFADEAAFLLQGFAGGLDAKFHDEGLGAAAEGFDKLPVQLTRGQVYHGGEVFHRDPFTEMFADPGHGAVDLQVGLKDLLLAFITLHCSHDSDDPLLVIEDGKFVGDKPVRNSLIIEEQLHDVDLRLAGGHHFDVVFAEVLRNAWRKQLEVFLTDDLLLGVKPEAFVKVLVRADELKMLILGKERDAGHMIKQPVESGVGRDVAQELLASGSGIFKLGRLEVLRGHGRNASMSP